MSQEIEEMIDRLIEREGGYVNHRHDRGGPTNFGITQKTLSQYLRRQVSERDVRNMTVSLAKEIYEQRFYYGPGFHKLTEALQEFCFDTAVNHGPGRAVKFLQTICNEAEVTEVEIDVDGALGPISYAAIRQTFDVIGEALFLKALFELRENFYYRIVDRDRSQASFINGWINRLQDLDNLLEVNYYG